MEKKKHGIMEARRVALNKDPGRSGSNEASVLTGSGQCLKST